MAEQFDVIVIGHQLSGVIAATLMAKRGHRVLLVDHGEDGHTYTRHGRCLPLVPTLVPCLDHSPLVQEVHRELGMESALRAATETLYPAFQAIMPEHRIDVTHDYHGLLEELQREFPESVRDVREFFDRLFALDTQLSTFLLQHPCLPPTGWRDHGRNWWARRALIHLDKPFEEHALLNGIAPDHPVRELLLGPLLFFGHLWTHTPSTFHAVRLIARYFRGAVSFDHDAEDLQSLWLRAAQTAGVVLKTNSVVTSLQIHNQRITDMALQNDPTTYRGHFYVTNSIGSLDHLLHTETTARTWPWQRHIHAPTLAPRNTSLRQVGALFTLNIVVHRDAIPCGMGHALFLLNGRRQRRHREDMDPPLFMRRYPLHPKRKTTGEEHENHDPAEIIAIACPVSLTDVDTNPIKCDELKQQILARVGRVIPFFNTYVQDVSIPSDAREWRDVSGETAPSVDPWRVYPFFESTKPLTLGIAAKSMRSRYKNGVCAGHNTIPGLGIEGDYMTGLAAARTVDLLAKRYRN